MPIERTIFDEIREADLDELIASNVPEGLTIEYKRDAYGKTDEQKREALKDITAFANSHGGHLIIGMDERDGLPIAKIGMSVTEAEELKARLEALMRDGVEPRMLGVRARLVDLSDGGRAVLLRIPKSWNPPHRISAQRSNRFWVRNSSGVHEASVEELRSLFTLASNTQERTEEFISQRAELIRRGKGPVRLFGTGTLITHIVPMAAFGQARAIDLELAYQLQAKFRPMAIRGYSPSYNLNGFINLGGGDEPRGYVQVFRAGAIEAALSDILDEHSGVTILWREFAGQYLVDVLPSYFEGLRALDVPPPFVVSVAYSGIGGSRLALKGFDHRLERIAVFPDIEPLMLPNVVVNDYLDEGSCAEAMKPIFDAIWNAAGFARCSNYDQVGNWRPED